MSQHRWRVVSVNSLLPQLQGPQQGPQVAGQQQDETVAQQDVTSHETVVAEAVTKSRNKRDTANVALRATTRSFTTLYLIYLISYVILSYLLRRADARGVRVFPPLHFFLQTE